AFVINGKVNGADVYASGALFQKLWPKLLKASAVEAVAEQQKGAAVKPASAEAVAAFLTDAFQGKTSRQEVKGRVQYVQRETAKIVLFETRDRKKKGEALHISCAAMD